MAKKTARPYHHGELAAALETETLRIIQDAGVAAVSLRELGRRLGVSRTAPYRHFADKEALLATLAKRGFESLTQTMEREIQTRGARTSRQRLEALAYGYLRFARRQPGHFRLLFGHRAFERPHPELQQAGATSFALLRDAVTACQRDGTFAGTHPDGPTLICWTAVHGYAGLLIDGHLGIAAAASDAQLQTILDGLYAGLGSRRARR